MPVFVDTNVLVYARDATAGDRQQRALAWVEHLWSTRTGRLSYQVLHEYYTVVTRKLRPGLSPNEAQADVRALLAWRPVALEERALQIAWQVEDRFALSFWDALIVAAARISACGHLLTEDLQDGQELNGLVVVDPFANEPAAIG